MSPRRIWSLLTALVLVNAAAARAQDGPYFVTYDHYLEEPGNLEIALANTSGMPRGTTRRTWRRGSSSNTA